MSLRTKVELTVFGSIGLFATYLSTANTAVIPARWAHEFWVAKGIVAATAVLAMALYMVRIWPNVTSPAQRQRYIALMVGIGIVMIASTAQYEGDAEVFGRNVGGMLFAFLTCWSMWTSWRVEPDGPTSVIDNARDEQPVPT